jgi:hypothetical protein
MAPSHSRQKIGRCPNSGAKVASYRASSVFAADAPSPALAHGTSLATPVTDARGERTGHPRCTAGVT